MNKVSTKLFRLDLDYFKKNFLNRKEWGKTHLLYENSTIKVELEQNVIVTSDNELGFKVRVLIVDNEYFKTTFGSTHEYGYLGSGINTFFIPIDHDDYTPEVFVKKVYGAFKEAYESAMGSYRNTTLTKKFNKFYQAEKAKAREVARQLYKKSRSTIFKELFDESDFVGKYINNQDRLNHFDNLHWWLGYYAHHIQAEKDTKLFCDILGLEYKPNNDIEKYHKKEQEARDILNGK